MPFRRTGFIAATLLLVCIAVLLAAGCAPKLAPEPLWEKNARALLDQADGFFSKKQYEQAAKTVEAFLYQYPTSRHRDRALFLIGEVRFTLRDYARALNYYKEVIQEYPASSFIIAAKYKLGQCYFELKDYDLAIANLEDRGRITDPVQLRRIAEQLSVAYLAKNNHLHAVKEFSYLAEAAQNDKQKAGYRDRVRELIDRNLTEDELKTLAAGPAYPSNLALLRLAGMQIEQKRYRDAAAVSKTFLEKFPNDPEKTRGEMLLNEASTKLTSPRYFIGVLVPQSGQLAFFGDRVLKGIQLAVHGYNLLDPDNRVELIVKDLSLIHI